MFNLAQADRGPHRRDSERKSRDLLRSVRKSAKRMARREEKRERWGRSRGAEGLTHAVIGFIAVAVLEAAVPSACLSLVPEPALARGGRVWRQVLVAQAPLRGRATRKVQSDCPWTVL